jgi:hypothetical protein
MKGNEQPLELMQLTSSMRPVTEFGRPIRLWFTNFTGFSSVRLFLSHAATAITGKM